MEKNGVRLGELVGGILNGVKTGLNDAFVITAAQRQELIEASPQSADLIRPHIVGDDIRKFGIESRQRFPGSREHLASMPAWQGGATAEDLIRADRDGRGW